METKTSEKPKNKQDVITLLAKAFGLPVAGINLEERLGRKAYINALGLMCAWKKYPDKVKIIEIKRIKIYENIGDSAITEVVATDEKGNFVSSIGSASAANMVMVKGYPAELSETRALNRVLRRALLPHLYEEYEKNVANMTQEERDLLSEYVSDFGRVSVEEMVADGEGEQQAALPMMTNEEMAQIKDYLEKVLGAQTIEELEEVGKTIKEVSLDLTENQTSKLRDAYRNRKNTLEKKKKE